MDVRVGVPRIPGLTSRPSETPLRHGSHEGYGNLPVAQRCPAVDVSRLNRDRTTVNALATGVGPLPSLFRGQREREQNRYVT
jgi:hypothetical protein